MKEKVETVKDPVCGRIVGDMMEITQYLGLEYAFCSADCKNRFIKHPGLYVGRPGKKAPKQEGKEILRHRTWHFTDPVPDHISDYLIDRLQNLVGVKDVDIDGNTLKISYDILLMTAEMIEDEIIKSGTHLGGNWLEKLQRILIHFEEDEEISKAEVTPLNTQT